MFIKNLNVFITFALTLICAAQAQFWKLNSLSEKELFILETKASMASGICYKEVPSNFSDPSLKFKTISYCCSGYTQDLNSVGMKCNPNCSENCTNGLCIAPNVCECYPGFMLVGKRCEDVQR